MTGTTFTDPADVTATIEGVKGENLFTLQTAPLEAALRDLPTVESAKVTIALPHTLDVAITEREAVMVWKVGARRYLAGADGELFARLAEDDAEGGEGLPVVEDRRASSAGLYGGRAPRHGRPRCGDPARLARPGRRRQRRRRRLVVWVTDENGFIVRARPASWAAVFGYYTASLRTTELIPGQVRLLRSLLYGREDTLDWVILASDTDGTYIAKPTPTPKPKPSP